MNSTTNALRLGLATALGACLIVPLTATANAGSVDLRKAPVKSRTLRALVDQGRANAGPSDAPRALPAPSQRALRSADADAGQPATGDAPPAAPVAASPTCDDLALDVTPATDRVWVHWKSVPTTGYTVLRLRDGGQWQVVGEAVEQQTSFEDTTVNPRGQYTYAVETDDVGCDLGAWVSMATDDGFGTPDAITGNVTEAGATGALRLQDPASRALYLTAAGIDPSFSPDARRLAAAYSQDGEAWSLYIILIGYGANRDDITLSADHQPTGTVGLEPAWSPDGERVVYTRYALDQDTGEVVGSELRMLTLRTHADVLVSGSDGLIQPAWQSPTTLVTAGLDPATGLYTLPASGGSRALVSDTSGAAYPEVAPDGTLYFVETGSDGGQATYRLRARAGDGSVRTVQQSTTHTFEQPRVSPDGSLFYVDTTLGDPADPADDTFTVMVLPSGETTPQPTAIGVGVSDAVMAGYDVRQPTSEGTSDFVGDANPEILGKDSAGRLWAYYSSDTKVVAGRVSMGAGWNMFNQVVAAGDLDGDDRGDVLGRKPDGTLWLYHGLGDGKVAAGRKIGSGWSSYVLVAPGDFTGDGKADLLGRDSQYQLWVYPGRGDGTFVPRRLLTSGWGGFSAIIGSGDVNFDGKADILGRERATGYLYLYPGDAEGAITGRTRLGAGWNSLNAFAAPEFTGITPGLFGRLANGSMRYYQVTGDGAFDADAVYPAGSGWNGFQITG